MTLQPILIFGLVLAALLYAVAMLLYRRKMSTKRWYTTIGTAIVTLLVFALLGSIFPDQAGPGTVAALAIISGVVTIGFAWLRRPQTG